jgi:hypothetical protein
MTTTSAQQSAIAQADAVRQMQSLKSNVGLIEGEILNAEASDADGSYDQSVAAVRYQDKDRISMWSMATGAHSYALRYMVPEFAKQQDAKKKPIWAFRESDIPEKVREMRLKVTKLRCFLHVDEPGSDKLFAMGFHSCIAASIPTTEARERHMKSSHSNALRALIQERSDRERSEDREDRQITRDLLRTIAGGQQPATAIAKAEVEPKKLIQQACEQCDLVLESTSKVGLSSKMRAHIRKTHYA